MASGTKDTRRYYLFIILYGLFIVLFKTGFKFVLGAKIDWLGQHAAFPELFRQNFYRTGRLLPNFVFELGGGQNIFNYSYYGLLSPLFLISYLFPFVDMVAFTYLMGVVQYLLGGVLAFAFMRKHFDSLRSFYASIVLLSMSPIAVYTHYHIMFVWYIPFLLLAFIGVDRYFEKKRSSLLVISVVCIILTSYYLSVGCLISLFIYSIYRILKNEEFSRKEFFIKVLKTGLLFTVPVLICAFFLLPTASALLNSGYHYKMNVSLKMLILPWTRNVLYTYFSFGLTGIMIASLIGNILSKASRKCDKFLNIVLLSLIVFPVFGWVLNGMLYINSKVMIPFLPLYIYCFVTYLEKLKEERKNAVLAAILTVLFLLVCYFFHREKNIWIFLAVIELALFVAFQKNVRLICLCVVVFILVGVYGNGVEYVTKDFINKRHTGEIKELLNEAKTGNYRSNVAHMDMITCNLSYGDNYKGVSHYSSTPNNHYLKFYENNIGNNKSEVNSIIMAGSRNELFYHFMGTRYIFSKTDPGFLYEKVKSSDKICMYENKNAFPIVYKSKKLISEKSFNKEKFPYNIELLMHNTVVNEAIEAERESFITKYDVDENYFFVSRKEREYKIELSEVFRDKILYLSFNMRNKKHHPSDSAWGITINGQKNLVNSPMNTYYNENTKFEYVIPMENTNILTVNVSSGIFDIYGLEMHYSDIDYENYTEADSLKFNEQNDTISCKVNAREGEYLVTSIPYDKGFTAMINGEEAETEIVNKAFVGLKLKEGKNNIVLQYRSPLLNVGYIISIIGLIAYVWILVKEKFFDTEE